MLCIVMPVSVIPQYPLYEDMGGFDKYNNQISHHRGNSDQIPIYIVHMRSIKSPPLCQIPQARSECQIPHYPPPPLLWGLIDKCITMTNDQACIFSAAKNSNFYHQFNSLAVLPCIITSITQYND